MRNNELVTMHSAVKKELADRITKIIGDVWENRCPDEWIQATAFGWLERIDFISRDLANDFIRENINFSGYELNRLEAWVIAAVPKCDSACEEEVSA